MFTYEPLKNDDDIRLLVLPPRPSSCNSKLHLAVATFTNQDAPPYEALSYVWGDPSNPVSITANGQDMEIGRNLYDALTHLQHKEQTRKVWVDAICINQNDNTEKSKQVSRMRDIYISAFSTLMWIGKEDVLPPSVAETFTNLLDPSWWRPRLDTSVAFRFPQLVPIPGPHHIVFEDSMFEDISTFLEQSYFSRSWITQEIAVSRQLIIVWGSIQFDFDELILALWMVRKYSRTEFRNITSFEVITGIRNSQQMLLNDAQQYQSSEEDSQSDYSSDDEETSDPCLLIQMVSVQRDRCATDARDKIYSVLGLSSDIDDLGVKTDYSMSVKTIYTDIAAKILKEYGPCLLSASQPQYSTLGLPSWVPDWSQHWRGGIERRDTFQCGRDIEKNVQVDLMEGSIRIRGIRLGIIKTASGTPFDQWKPDPNWPMDFQERLENEMTRLGYEGHYPPTGQKYSTVLLDVLTAGRGRLVERGYSTTQNLAMEAGQIAWNPFDPGRGKVESLLKNLAWCDGQWDLFETDNCYLGLGPKSMAPGDIVCIFGGSRVPHILRPLGGNGFKFIGDSYVHGVMHGELRKDKESITEETFCIH